MTIPTYIINLKMREDRLGHITNQFEGKEEFEINIIEAHTHKFGCIGLWNTIKHIVRDLADSKEEYILICEDDHLFTADYSRIKLFEVLEEAKSKFADVIIGGPSWFEDAVQISDNLFSVNKFSGTQFTLVFKKFFSKILQAEFSYQDTADAKICSLSDSIYFINPFISVQKEFGYSDATDVNNGTQRVQSLFIKSSIRAKIAANVNRHYKNSFDINKILTSTPSYNRGWSIPTYIINLDERKLRKKHILRQFKNRPEFDIHLVQAVKHEIGAFGHWQSIRKIIELALRNEDDVIIISEDDHEFTPQYSKDEMLQAIILSHELGCDYISGGTGKFDIAVPVTDNLFWTNHCLSAQFVIIFKRFFQKILDSRFDQSVIGDIKLSELSPNKMLIVPFISTQKDFGLSDVTKLHNDQKGIVQEMFFHSAVRLNHMRLVYSIHKSDVWRQMHLKR